MPKFSSGTNTMCRFFAGLGLMIMFSCGAIARGNPTIAIVQDDGTMFYEDGDLSVSNVVRRFYANHSDAFDFVVIFTTEYHMQNSESGNYVRNDVTGIGIDLSSIAAYWGSAGRLRGFAEMRPIDTSWYDPNLNNGPYRALIHEIGHTWLADVGSLPSGNPISDSGRHFWNGLISTDPCTGIMRDMHWILNGDGTWSQLYYEPFNDCLGKFHPIGLYLMGFEDPTNLTQSFQVLNGDWIDRWSGYYYDEDGIPVAFESRYDMTVESFTINDVINVLGSARSPSFESAPRDFSIAYILVTEQGQQPTTAQLDRLEAIAAAMPAKWAYATSNLSSIVEPPGPTLSPAYCKDGTAIGDANGDGAFTMADEEIVATIYAGNAPAPSRLCCIDINQNGTISLADWLKTKRIVAGLAASPGTCHRWP